MPTSTTLRVVIGLTLLVAALGVGFELQQELQKLLHPSEHLPAVLTSDASLDGDVHCTNLTVLPGVILTTNGYNIFVRGPSTIWEPSRPVQHPSKRFQSHTVVQAVVRQTSMVRRSRDMPRKLWVDNLVSLVNVPRIRLHATHGP